jgi:hypothetical protein
LSDSDSNTFCAQCGIPIADESPTGDPAQRKPCKNCGSLARAFNVSIAETISVSMAAQVEALTYPQSLLAAAKSLIDMNHFGISVVVMHMACEIATDRTISEYLIKNGIQYMEESINDLINGYNLANPRIRNLYTALTGDDIQNKPFWQQFVESAKRRNNIIHKGLIIGESEAKDSYAAVSDILKHLGK